LSPCVLRHRHRPRHRPRLIRHRWGTERRGRPSATLPWCNTPTPPVLRVPLQQATTPLRGRVHRPAKDLHRFDHRRGCQLN
jgi:hypothetical protein